MLLNTKHPTCFLRKIDRKHLDLDFSPVKISLLETYCMMLQNSLISVATFAVSAKWDENLRSFQMIMITRHWTPDELEILSFSAETTSSIASKSVSEYTLTCHEWMKCLAELLRCLPFCKDEVENFVLPLWKISRAWDVTSRAPEPNLQAQLQNVEIDKKTIEIYILQLKYIYLFLNYILQTKVRIYSSKQDYWGYFLSKYWWRHLSLIFSLWSAICSSCVRFWTCWKLSGKKCG